MWGTPQSSGRPRRTGCWKPVAGFIIATRGFRLRLSKPGGICPGRRCLRLPASSGGVTNGYVEPEALGADRWAAIVAAYQGSAKPVCVIDCGTAITLDVVDADGIHQGGLIAPGLDMMRRSLVTGTSAIGSLVVEARSASPLLARNTTDGVNNGTMRMAGALIDRVIEEAAADYGRDLQAVITGGDAGRLQPLLRCSPRYDRDLVLKGIAILARDIAVPITPSPVGRGLG